MKNQLFCILLLFLTAFAAGCDKAPATQTIAQAEEAFQQGNIKAARERCLELSDTSLALSSTELCQVAMLYMRIAEITDDQSDMAAAAQCYTRAMILDADSVSAYLDNLIVEDQSLARLLRDISTAVTSPDSIVEADDEEISAYDNPLDVEP